jgi:hypothetical protein
MRPADVIDIASFCEVPWMPELKSPEVVMLAVALIVTLPP